jgi:hypothetical protein
MPPKHAPQTDEQTLHLAMVLDEMAHHLETHHLETLSHQQVLLPSVLGLQIDILRALIWPFTIVFGPAGGELRAREPGPNDRPGDGRALRARRLRAAV